jgi:hypothetical protein
VGLISRNLFAISLLVPIRLAHVTKARFSMITDEPAAWLQTAVQCRKVLLLRTMGRCRHPSNVLATQQ